MDGLVIQSFYLIESDVIILIGVVYHILSVTIINLKKKLDTLILNKQRITLADTKGAAIFGAAMYAVFHVTIACHTFSRLQI